MFGIDLLFGLGGYLLKNIAIWFAFLAIKKYIIWGILVFIGFWCLRATREVFMIISTLLQSTAGKLLLACLVGLLAGGTLGYMAHTKIAPKVKVEAVKLNKEMIRSKNGAVVVDGVVYYKSVLVNNLLRHYHANRTLPESLAA